MVTNEFKPVRGNLSIRFAAVAAMFVLIIMVGCSGSNGSPVEPEPASELNVESGHTIWGSWLFEIGEDRQTIISTPARLISGHYDVTDALETPGCDGCLEVEIVSIDMETGVMSLEVTLWNPTDETVYDVRGIIFTDDAGHELLNPDGWTRLYDIPGGGILNPFRAFAKLSEKRKFKLGEDHTEMFEIVLPDPPEYVSIGFAVDVSWPGNCAEPYEIANFWQESIFPDTGSEGNIYVDVKDWQSDVSKVTLVAPEITGEEFTQFHPHFQDTWKLQLVNASGASPGNYRARIIAQSGNVTGDVLYDYVDLFISEYGVPSMPVDITPPYLNFSPLDVAVQGNYAYTASGFYGMHIFDVSDPLNPEWVNWVNTPGNASAIDLYEGYAFVADGVGDLQIIDVDPPGSAHIVRSVYSEGNILDVVISQGLAFVIDSASGFGVFTIEPPDMNGSISFLQNAWGNNNRMMVRNGFAYFLNNTTMYVYDIDPIESAYKVGYIQTGGYGPVLKAVDVEAGYAYLLVLNRCEIYEIVDDLPKNLVMEFEVQNEANDLRVLNGYIYFSGVSPNLLVAYPDLTNLTYQTYMVYAPGAGFRFCLQDGLAYIANGSDLGIVDIDPVEFSHPIGSADTLFETVEIGIADGYAYAADYSTGLKVIDISNPQLPRLVDAVDSSKDSNRVIIDGNIAYVARVDLGMDIFDISKPESVERIKSVYRSGLNRGFAYQDGIVYYTNYDGYGSQGYGLTVIDVDPPGDAHVLGDIDGLYTGGHLDVKGDYLYSYYYKLIISDISTYGYVDHLSDLQLPWTSWKIAVHGKYAYTFGYYNGVGLVNIENPEAPFQVGKLYDVDFYQTNAMIFSGNYAYLASDESGIVIADMSNPLQPLVVTHIDTLGRAMNIALDGNYAYVSDWNGGMRILKLW